MSAARALGLGLPLLWIGIAEAQVAYTPVEASGIIVTGVRSSSATTDDVVVTGSAVVSGGTVATLYSGSLGALPAAPASAWNILTPDFGPGQTVTSSTFYGPNTALFDAGIPAGSVRAVGSYKYSNSPNPNFDHGMIYEGPATGGGTWTQIDPPSTLVPPGETLKNTIAHSTMGDLVVGNWDTNLAVGRAFVYDLSHPGSPWTDLVIPTAANPTGSKSVTAYGIWQNSGGSYTIAGGLSDLNSLGADEGYLADYDPATGVSHVKTYNFDNRPITSLISHFDGITVTDGGYNLTGDYFNPGSGPDDAPVGAFFASVRRLPNGEFGEATWTDIAFTSPSFQNVQFTSGNTVIGDNVLGIFTGDAVPCGSCLTPVTLSYVAAISTPEPGALATFAVGFGMLGLVRLRVSRRS